MLIDHQTSMLERVVKALLTKRGGRAERRIAGAIGTAVFAITLQHSITASLANHPGGTQAITALSQQARTRGTGARRRLRHHLLDRRRPDRSPAPAAPPGAALLIT
jgi:hypothetical protein